jgi:hypothetical protein
VLHELVPAGKAAHAHSPLLATPAPGAKLVAVLDCHSDIAPYVGDDGVAMTAHDSLDQGDLSTRNLESRQSLQTAGFRG